jgi:hypothetical protein
MSNGVTPQQCSNCIFMRMRASAYECRYYPPSSAVGTAGAVVTNWPAVAATDWCGQFQPVVIP